MPFLEIQGWKYLSEVDAQTKEDQVNTFYGYPKAGDEETLKYASYSDHYAEGGEVTFWYFEYHADIEAVLGAPESFDVYVQ